ncbi:unnamed protein product [Phytomonas sp. Hart1]|nr:unnamed protein product [Phytomonas sp. Hart1]|eukprot:CCW68068.1 unnamed protein product [Phytomonas sp. isolate Hart1]
MEVLSHSKTSSKGPSWRPGAALDFSQPLVVPLERDGLGEQAAGQELPSRRRLVAGEGQREGLDAAGEDVADDGLDLDDGRHRVGRGAALLLPRRGRDLPDEANVVFGVVLHNKAVRLGVVEVAVPEVDEVRARGVDALEGDELGVAPGLDQNFLIFERVVREGGAEPHEKLPGPGRLEADVEALLGADGDGDVLVEPRQPQRVLAVVLAEEGKPQVGRDLADVLNRKGPRRAGADEREGELQEMRGGRGRLRAVV